MKKIMSTVKEFFSCLFLDSTVKRIAKIHKKRNVPRKLLASRSSSLSLCVIDDSPWPKREEWKFKTKQAKMVNSSLWLFVYSAVLTTTLALPDVVRIGMNEMFCNNMFLFTLTRFDETIRCVWGC